MQQRQKVFCPKCGREISKSNITKHEKSCNGVIHTPKYVLTHDGLDCQFCGKTCKNRNSLCNHERLCSANPNRQTNGSGLEKFNRERENNNVVSWNKGLTKDTDERVAAYGEKISQNIRTNGAYFTGKCLSEEHRQKISNTVKNKVLNNEWHVSLARKMHHNYKGADLHGTWELAYAKWLDSQNILWERTKTKFPYVYKDKLRHYTPDFYLPTEDIYIEIKGYSTKKDEAKWSQFPADKKLQILLYDDLINLGINL